MGLCRIPDDFINEKVRWVITLSNNEVIFQDDDRPGEEVPSAWLRLKKYVEQNSLNIIDFKIQFCSHIEDAAPPMADGYYFAKKVEAYAFSGSSQSTWNYYVVGALINGKIYTTQWMIPEIIKTGHDIREVIDGDIHLIVNK